MYSDFLQITNTKEELEMLIDELERVAASLYETDTLNQTMGSVRSTTANTVEAMLSSLDKSDHESAIRELIERLKKTEEIELTLAVEPTRAMLSRITSWLRENVDGSIVVDVVVDPRIVAGAKVSFKGKYHDYSYDEKIKKIINQG